jgi:hypothetical protein
MTASLSKLLAKPWIWSYIGALLVWLASILFTRGYAAGGMVTAALSLAAFMVVVGVGQMFVISLGPGNVDLSLPANIGLASAVAMKVMAGDDGLVAIGLLAALFCGLAIGTVNYLLIWALRIPPIIATLSASFIIQSIDIGFGRGLQIKPPTGFADFTNIQILGIPLLAILTVLFTAGASVALQRTAYGRSVLAIGQNMRAARLAGIRVGLVRFATAWWSRWRIVGRLFPRCQCRHWQRISAGVHRRGRDWRNLGRRRQGERSRHLGRGPVPGVAAHHAQYLWRQRGGSVVTYWSHHCRSYYCGRWKKALD